MSLVVVSVALLLLEFCLEQEHRHLPTVILASEIITVIFIIELSLRWFAAPSTRAHWREYWLDWLAVVALEDQAKVRRYVGLEAPPPA